MPNNDYANEPNQSRSEEIIQSILDNTEYDEAARSRIEYLLIELKNAIEGGGGGGGVTSYSPLTEKPKIDNHTLQAGNNTSSDLGLQTKLTFDSAPTESSTNPVTSGGVYTALGTKANSADVYNKSAVDTALGAKADKSTTYTKTEVDTALSSKQNTISDLSTIRSGAALGATAVQPVSGKGLSTNDYTTAEKEKLAGIETQANKTTVDSALSESSTNPVQNKVVKSALDGKQATLTAAQLAAVNSGITSTDVEQIETNENNILSNQNSGFLRKNLFLPTKQSDSFDGAVITAGSGGTYTITSTSQTTQSFVFTLGQFTGKSGKTYYVSGCPISSNKISLRVGSNYYGEGIATYIGTGASVNVTISFLSGFYTDTPLVFKPMISESNDDTFVPYALSNAELTAKEQTNENNILSVADQSTQYNIAQGRARTLDSVTSTVSGYTITFSGTSSGTRSFSFLKAFSPPKSGDYVWKSTNGVTIGGTPISVYMWDATANVGVLVTDIDGGLKVNLDSTHVYTLAFTLQNNAVVSGDYSVMIISKDLWDSGITDFQPYAMSNAELTDNKQEKNAINIGTTNFDDIKLGGTYFSGNVGTSQNAPTSGYFFLNVIHGASDSILQEAYRLNSPDKVYRRQFITNAWSAWYVFAGTVVS